MPGVATLAARRARRASQGGAWSPFLLPGLVAWWSTADLPVVADGSSVSSWTDRVGGLTVTQATGAKQPAYVAAGANARPGLRFTRANSTYLANTSSRGALPTVAPFTVVVVMNHASSVSQSGGDQAGLEVATATNNGYMVGLLGNQQMFLTSAVDSAGGGNFPANENHVIFLTANAGGRTIVQRDNRYPPIDTGPVGTITTPGQGCAIGGSAPRSGGSALDGTIYDVIVTTNDMTTANRYLLAKWITSRYKIETGTPYNGAAASTTPSYDGSNTTIEHSILDFGAGGFGSPTAYRYVGAMAPYPSNNNTFENPSILGSNDGVTWATFNGVTNPVVPYPGGGNAGNNADSRLFDNRARDGNFYLYHTVENAIAANNGVWVIQSTDLVNWTNHQGTLTGLAVAGNAQEANVVWDGTQYVLLTSHSTTLSDVNTYLERRTSSSPTGPWSAPTTVIPANACPSGNSFWHVGDVIKVGNKWITGLSDNTPGTGNQPGRRGYMVSSPDLINWKFTPRPIYVPPDVSGWDVNVGCYRLSFTDTGSGLQMWYTANGSGTANRLGKGGVVAYSEIP